MASGPHHSALVLLKRNMRVDRRLSTAEWVIANYYYYITALSSTLVVVLGMLPSALAQGPQSRSEDHSGVLEASVDLFEPD